MDVAIMVEGQSGLNWPRWQRLAQAVEALGFAALYRSDHLINAQLPDQDSLDTWVSFAWLASHTTAVEYCRFANLSVPLILVFQAMFERTDIRRVARHSASNAGMSCVVFPTTLESPLGASRRPHKETAYLAAGEPANRYSRATENCPPARIEFPSDSATRSTGI